MILPRSGMWVCLAVRGVGLPAALAYVCSLCERLWSRDAGRWLLRPTGTECPNLQGAQASNPQGPDQFLGLQDLIQSLDERRQVIFEDIPENAKIHSVIAVDESIPQAWA